MATLPFWLMGRAFRKVCNMAATLGHKCHSTHTTSRTFLAVQWFHSHLKRGVASFSMSLFYVAFQIPRILPSRIGRHEKARQTAAVLLAAANALRPKLRKCHDGAWTPSRKAQGHTCRCPYRVVQKLVA